MKRFILAVIVLYFGPSSSFIYSQNASDPYIVIAGSVNDENYQKLSGVKVEIKQDNQVFKSVTTSPKGKYDAIEIPYGYIYIITFSKNNYATKSILIDSKSGYFKEEQSTQPFAIPITLQSKKPGIDYSVVSDQHVGKIRIIDGNLSLDNVYNKQRKNEIDRHFKAIEEQAKLKESQFNKFLYEGDNALNKEDYSLAILKYEEALKIHKDDLVENKIKKAKKNLELISQEKELNKQYNDLITKGDNALSSGNNTLALENFKKAKELNPGNQIAYDKIKQVEKANDLAAQKEILEKYNLKMNAAKSALDNKNYQQAIDLYKEAATINPSDRTPKDKINDINKILANEKESEEEFNNLIAKADAQLLEKSFNESIINYKKALKIKPNESHPTEQIKVAEQGIKDQIASSENDRKYENIVKTADNQLKNLEYQLAKATYQQALDLKSDEKYPLSKITFIEEKLKEIADAKSKMEESNKAYQAEILKADELFNEAKFEEALISYQSAKMIKEDESYPDQKINEINIKITHIANQQKESQKKYSDFIKNADASFKSQNWKLSKQFYNNALSVDESQEYPKKQLEIIEQKINEQEALLAESKEKLEKFNSLISQGDNSLKTEDFDVSKSKYLEAKELFPKNSTVDQKLKHLNFLIDQKQKLNQSDSSFKELITQADKLRDNEKWEEAINKYKMANKIKTLDTYSKQQIDLIKIKISEQANSNIQSQYQELIKSADELLLDSSYDEAIQKYDEANEISPNESYPIQKIREIKRLIIEKESKDNEYQTLISQADKEFSSESYEDALNHYISAKNIYNKEYPNQRIEEINLKLNDLKSLSDQKASKRSQYEELIKNADQLFTENNFIESQSKYQEALNLFGNEYYPKKKLSEIKLKLEEIQSKEEVEKNYQNIISRADALRDENKYLEAKLAYQKAKLILPQNKYPDEQIAIIEKALIKQRENQTKTEYDNVIKIADENFNNKKYVEARDLYKKAREIDYNNDYPNQKIVEINQLLSELSNRENDEKRNTALQNKFDALILKAEDAKANNMLSKAKEFYLQASKILPNDPIPNSKIVEIEKLMVDQFSNKSKKKYDDFIAKAEKFFSDKNYDKSIIYYRKAWSVLPDETEPKEKINQVSEAKITALNNMEKINQYNSLIKQGKRYISSKSYSLAIESFQNASKVNPDGKEHIGKVAEINKLMDQDASNGLSSNQSILNSYSLMYGKEVSGKYNEEQIDRMMGSEKSDDFDKLGENADFKKSVAEQFSVKNRSKQELKTSLQNDQISIFYKNIQKSFENSNDSRWNNIPKVVDYKEMNMSNMGEIYLFSLENTTRNFNKIETQNQLLENKEVFRSEIIAKNDLVVDKFYDNKSVNDLEWMNRGISTTYSNSIQNELLFTDFEIENIARTNNRDLLIDKIDTYKEDLSIISEEEEGHSENSTYNFHVFTENMLGLFNNNTTNLDETRQTKTIPSFGYYENDFFNKNSSINIKSINNTYSNFENSQTIISKLNDFSLIADELRNTNSLNLDHYLDKELSKVLIWGDVSTDKVYNIHFINEMYQDELALDGENREDGRVSNTFNLEIYSDSYLASQGQFNKSDLNSDYLTAQFLEDSKGISVKKASSTNTQKLAQQFPQGITEKIYERKDSNGNVTELTIVRIVVSGNKGSEYKKVKSKYGVSYFKNGGIISQNIWDTETN